MLAVPLENAGFGSSLAAGDFNCDGYTDLAIGAPWDDVALLSFGGSTVIENAGTVTVLFGSSGGLSTSNNVLLYHEPWTLNGVGLDIDHHDLFGLQLAAGNFNGDQDGGNSCSDLAIAVPNANIDPPTGGGPFENAGAVYVLYGAGGGLGSSKRNEVWHQNISGMQGALADDDYFGVRLRVADSDMDGYSDLWFYVPGDESFGTIYGSSSGLTSSGNGLWASQTPHPGFPLTYCTNASDGTKRCWCHPNWTLGAGCGFFELLCDAYGMDYEDAGGGLMSCRSHFP
jgi:hypothetical protein